MGILSNHRNRIVGPIYTSSVDDPGYLGQNDAPNPYLNRVEGSGDAVAGAGSTTDSPDTSFAQERYAYNERNGAAQAGSTGSGDAAAAQQVASAAVQTAGAASTSGQPQTKMSGDGMQRIMDILGKSPEEKAVEDEKLRRANLSRQAVMRFFDGLRYLGYSAGLSGHTPATQFSSSAEPLEKNYQEALANRQRLDAESAAYKLKVYEMQQAERQRQRQDEQYAQAQEDRQRNLQRQAEQDRQAAEERAEERRYNTARAEYQEKINENLGQKFADEHTVKTSQANRNNRTGSGKTGGKSGGKGGKNNYMEALAQDEREHPNETVNWRLIKTDKQAEAELNRRRNSRSRGSGSGSGSGASSGSGSGSGNFAVTKQSAK